MSAHPIAEARGTRSVSWLADQSAVPALTIARIEAGLTNRPTRDTLDRIARALGTTGDDLEIAIVRHHQAQAAEATS